MTIYIVKRLFLILAACLWVSISQAQVAPVGNWVPGGISGAPGCESVSPNLWSSTFFFGAGGGSPWVVLSGGGLTSQQDTAGVNNTVTEISTRCHTTGKYCFEYTTIRAGGASMVWGIAAATQINNTALGNAAGTPTSMGYNDFSAQLGWRFNGAAGANTGLTISGGQVIAECHDLPGGKAWIQNVNTGLNTWIGATSGAADPSTDTNGYTYAAFGVPVYPAWTSAQNGGANGATLNDCAARTWTMPTGYACW